MRRVEPANQLSQLWCHVARVSTQIELGLIDDTASKAHPDFLLCGTHLRAAKLTRKLHPDWLVANLFAFRKIWKPLKEPTTELFRGPVQQRFYGRGWKGKMAA